MRDLSEATLAEITQRIVEALHPRMIYLHRSHAYGTRHRDSDVDLLVIVDTQQDHMARLTTRGYAALHGLRVSVELNVVSEEGFSRRVVAGRHPLNET